MLRPITVEDEAELLALDPADCAATRALVPAFKNLNPDAAFNCAINAFIAGIAHQAERPEKLKAAATNSLTNGGRRARV